MDVFADHDLMELMQKELVVMHDFVLLELACGNLKSRRQLLGDLKLIPSIEPVSSKDNLDFLEKHALHGVGLGMVDLNILATCSKNHLYVYTYDAALKRHALKLGLFSFR